MADAFKRLIEKKFFTAISISDIFDECNMHRKSFYYHFKDKYDLVAWIYNTETSSADGDLSSAKSAMVKLMWEVNYLYENRDLYSKLL